MAVKAAVNLATTDVKCGIMDYEPLSFGSGAVMENGTPGRFVLSLLGRFELIGPEGSVELASKKAAGLLALLACAAPEQQRREKLAGLLWGSHFEAHARQNLRQTLYVLRRILGEGSVVTNGQFVSLKPGVVVCDVPQFEALIRRGTRDALAAAVELRKGELLAGFSIAQDPWEEWLTRERQRLKRLALDALVRLGKIELASGHAEAAIAVAERAIGEDDVREDAHRLLMRALGASGRRPEALRHYDNLVALLKRELDVEPDVATIALAHELRRPASASTEPAKHPSAVSRATNSDNATLPCLDRPSIVVLPFANMSGNPDEDYLADGISEDLITGLSHIRWLFVMSRDSTFAYKQRAVDVKQISRELGVRYVLGGSVRRAGKQLRISAQLVDATTGGHHWAERYDRERGDIFAVQDEITRSVAAAIEPHLLAAEGLRALSRSADDLGAWALVARARTRSWRLTRADYETAIEALQRAVGAYPDYAPARSSLGFCLVFAAHMGWIDRQQGLLPGRQHAMRAIALDDRDPWGYIALGVCAMVERRTEESIAALRRALNLNPNSAVAHSHLSRVYAFAGEYGEALEHGNHAIRLSSFDPDMALFLGGFAAANYAAGRYAEAADYAAQAVRLRPGFLGVQRMRCASLAQAGRVDEARSLLATIQREQPQLSIDWVKANVPYQTPHLIDHYLEGMRKLGLKLH